MNTQDKILWILLFNFLNTKLNINTSIIINIIIFRYKIKMFSFPIIILTFKFTTCHTRIRLECI